MKSLICSPKSILTIIAGVFISSAYAENLSTSTIEVVSPTPLQTLGVPINEVPANVQIGTSQDIKSQQPLSLADYMQDNLSAVNISNGTGNPYQPDVEYRGFTASPQVGQPAGLSVYFDGVRFNEPFGDIVNWDLIPMNAISSINLMPGSNPLFGLNTLGGALAVNTKNGQDFQGVNLTQMFGSWGTRNTQFEAGGIDKTHNLDYFFAGNFYDTNGWREGTSSNVNQLFSKLRWHNDANSSNLEFTMALGDNIMNQGQTLPMSMMNDPRQAYTGPDWVKNKAAFINIKGSDWLSDTKLLEGNVYYRRSNAKSMNSNVQFPNHDCSGTGFGSGGTDKPYCWTVTDANLNSVQASNVYSSTYQTALGASMQLSSLGDLLGHKNKLTTGASLDVSYVRFNQNTFLASLIGNQTINDPSLSSGYFLEDAVKFRARNYYSGLFATDNFSVTDKLNLTASARYNVAQIRLSGSDNQIYDAQSNANGSGYSDLNGSHTYSRLNPAVGLTYNLDKALGFYGSYNEGMRAPNAMELECADPSKPCALPTGFTADPNLKMVVAKTWETGMRGLLADNWHWNAGFFSTNTTNEIQFILDTNSTGYFKNVGMTNRKGVELGTSGRIDKLSLAARYSYVDATYQSSFQMASNSDIANGQEQIVKGNHMPGVAKNSLKLRAAYDITPQWNVGSNFVLASSQWAHGDEFNQDPAGKIPGYGYMNLDSNYKFDNNWSVFAKVNNVFDKQYSTFGMINSSIYGNGSSELFVTPSLPRAGFVGVTYSFGGAKKSSVDADKD